jgi:hypothetical protein
MYGTSRRIQLSVSATGGAVVAAVIHVSLERRERVEGNILCVQKNVFD